MDLLIKNIKELMSKDGYTEVTKGEYHKVKRKFKHGVWRIDKSYYYFINYSDKTQPAEVQNR